MMQNNNRDSKYCGIAFVLIDKHHNRRKNKSHSCDYNLSSITLYLSLAIIVIVVRDVDQETAQSHISGIARQTVAMSSWKAS